MKPSKAPSIFNLFISHIYMYSFFYLILNEGIIFVKTDFYTVYFDAFDFLSIETYFKLFKDFIFTVLFCPISLLFMEGLCILFYPVIFLIINYFKPNSPVFKTYIISAILTTFLTFTLLYISNEYYLKIVVMSYDGELEYNKLFFMIPSLLVAIFLNKMIFKRNYKRLKMEKPN